MWELGESRTDGDRNVGTHELNCERIEQMRENGRWLFLCVLSAGITDCLQKKKKQNIAGITVSLSFPV